MTYPGPAPSSSVAGAPAGRWPAPPRQLLAAIAFVALIGAGCSNAPAETGSGGGGGEGAAATAGASTEPDAGAAAEGGPIPREHSLAFAECMRENGVADFPDPDDNGVIQYRGDPDPATFTSAQESCRHFRPTPEGENAGNGG